MARRTSTTAPAQSSTEAASTTNEESTVTTTVEAPVETDASTEQNDEQNAGESTPSTTAPAAKATEPDLTAFLGAVETALPEADETTGQVATAHLAPIQAAYRDLDSPKAKAAARKVLDVRMKEFMTGDDIRTARAYLSISQNLATAGAGKSAPKAPADPTEAHVQRAAGLRLALNLVTADVPEGVDEGWVNKAREAVESVAEQAQAYLAWVNNEAEDKGDAPEVPAWVSNAVKLAAGKSAKVGGTRASAGGGSTFDGPRRDIAKHIQSAFADAEPGTFKVIAEIRNHRSEEYGDNPPSAGAISARLFPASGKVTVEGVVPATENGKKGARKV